MIREIFNNACDLLSDEDQKLPQIKWILPFLLRGIGIHHSGLLPLLKECIEILFGEGLLKILFATETFAMGLNMPARTVLFTSARKFDGRENRWISSGEYIQVNRIFPKPHLIFDLDERKSWTSWTRLARLSHFDG